MKLKGSKLKSEIKLNGAGEKNDFPLRDLNSNHLINQLEENIKLRETPIIERLKNKLKK